MAKAITQIDLIGTPAALQALVANQVLPATALRDFSANSELLLTCKIVYGASIPSPAAVLRVYTAMVSGGVDQEDTFPFREITVPTTKKDGTSAASSTQQYSFLIPLMAPAGKYRVEVANGNQAVSVWVSAHEVKF